MPQDIGDDWEEQQRRWAGGKGAAAGSRQTEDFSEIEEAAAGVTGDRYGYAGGQSTAGRTTGGHGGVGAGVQRDDSRDSTSSLASSSGMLGGRRKPGQGPPSLPLALSQVMKMAPPEAIHGSSAEQV